MTQASCAPAGGRDIETPDEVEAAREPAEAAARALREEIRRRRRPGD